MVLADYSKAKSDKLEFGVDLTARAVLTSLAWLAVLSGNGSLLAEYSLWIWTEKNLEVDKGSVSPAKHSSQSQSLLAHCPR